MPMDFLTLIDFKSGFQHLFLWVLEKLTQNTADNLPNYFQLHTSRKKKTQKLHLYVKSITIY